MRHVIVASPRPTLVTLTAAKIAGADMVIRVGGAHAIAAMAYGIGEIPRCDVIVGPGNRWVTAAKQLVSGTVGWDMLAGPSELTILADSSADPDVIAADLLAQAEHDPDAKVILVTTATELIAKCETALARRLANLPTADTARRALVDNGIAVVVDDIDQAISTCDAIAPEHLEILTTSASDIANRCNNWGGLFIGPMTAEVFGDYGAGPNHTLPTGGTARFSGGLSVFDFLRIRTYIRIDDPAGAQELVNDSERLARIEGLFGHAESAAVRRR